MNEQKTQIPSVNTWLEQLGDLLSHAPLGRPVIQKAAASAGATMDEMFWWTCDSDPAIWVGVTDADAESLPRIAATDLREDATAQTRVNFSDLMNRSWGRAGAIAGPRSAPIGNADLYDIQFDGGEKIRLALARVKHTIPAASNLEVLMDIELPITLRFGSTQMALKDIVGLGAGSVIEFDRGVDEPVEIMVNGHVIGQGEAVSVGDAYGIRVLEISSRRERLISSSFPMNPNGTARPGDRIQ